MNQRSSSLLVMTFIVLGLNLSPLHSLSAATAKTNSKEESVITKPRTKTSRTTSKTTSQAKQSSKSLTMSTKLIIAAPLNKKTLQNLVKITSVSIADEIGMIILTREDESIRTVNVPDSLTSLPQSEQISIVEAVINALENFDLGIMDETSDSNFRMSLISHLTTSLAEEYDEDKYAIISKELIEPLASTMTYDYAQSYIDVTVEQVQAAIDETMSMAYGAACEGGYSYVLLFDQNTYNGNPSFEIHNVDANGVDSYQHYGGTYPDTSKPSFSGDNDLDNNGYPDYNNDGGFDWPFSNNIWDRTESGIPMLVGYYTSSLLTQNNVDGLIANLRSNQITSNSFQDGLENALNGFYSNSRSDTGTTSGSGVPDPTDSDSTQTDDPFGGIFQVVNTKGIQAIQQKALSEKSYDLFKSVSFKVNKVIIMN